MELNEEELKEPVTPSGLYFNSSILCVSNLAILESETPIDDSQAISLLRDIFIPINPRFSSVMITDMDGKKQWKKVTVNIKDHINIPTFPAGLSPKSYDKYLEDYLSNIALEQFPQSQPLWDIHIIKYPTSNASGNLIFKLHHALGDGFSLMGALLSCLQRADDPSLPLTFPSRQSASKSNYDNRGIFKAVTKFIWTVFNTISDFSWSFLMSTVMKDDPSLIRSEDVGVEFRPMTIANITLSLDDIKQVKSKLGVTVNDVLTGVIFLGIRLYMLDENKGSSKERTTALVLLSTRNIGTYKSVQEMIHPNRSSSWGNEFAFLHVPLPELINIKSTNPLDFVWNGHHAIKKKRNSFGFLITSKLLDLMRKFRGYEATAKLIYNTLINSSMTISNMIGPVEPMALSNQRCKGLYFMVAGSPQNLTITIMSYMGQLRIAVGTEKDFIDSNKFMSCLQKSFDMIFEQAMKTSQAI